MNRFRTVRSFCLNGWGVSYNGKGRSVSVFVSFRKNGTITLYYVLTLLFSFASVSFGSVARYLFIIM